MKQHYVTFLSPGSFFPEESTRKVDGWYPDLERQSLLADGAFAFYFTTRERADDELDSRQTAKSGRYYLGGEVFHLSSLPQDAAHRTLRSNIEQFEGQNAIKCRTGNWQPFLPADTLLGGFS
jgi:hypothetical protein